MYRDDVEAGSARARALVDEIADLESKKLEQVVAEQRLAAARRELAELMAAPTTVAPRPSAVTLLVQHVGVFCLCACAGAGVYMLLTR